MATVYGYARVSSRDQNLNRQLDALSAYGVEPANVFADRASGKDFDRPQYRELLHALASGDVLVVLSIDRLGRNYSEILEEWRRITKELGAAIVVLDMPLLDTRARDCGGSDVTSTLIADIVLQLLSYVAQVERENIHRRQAEGIAAARARGVRFGRPRKPCPPQFERVRDIYEAGNYYPESGGKAFRCVRGDLRSLDARDGVGVPGTRAQRLPSPTPTRLPPFACGWAPTSVVSPIP